MAAGVDQPVRRCRSRPVHRGDEGAQAAGRGEGRGHRERGEPGYYTARFFLRPHFQLEGMDIGGSASCPDLPGPTS